jgi:site-specific DNA-methyltransferase (adenine-specific)
MNINNYINKIIHGNCIDFISKCPSEVIDLTVTSPPYDNLREYKGFVFDCDSLMVP